MPRVYLQVSFPGSARRYTYHYDGPAEVRPGTMVKVSSRMGRQTVQVLAISAERPTFDTKPIDQVVTQ